MTKNKAIEYLQSLSDNEFVQIFYEATDGRNIFGSDVAESKMILANASKDHGAEDKWNFELLAAHDPQEHPEGWGADAPICQEAESQGFTVYSYAKQMICPFTGGKISGT